MSSFSNRLSVLTSAVTTDPRQAPRLARQLGFNGLLFDAFSPQLSIPDLSITGRRELLRILSNVQEPLIGLQMDLGAKGLGPGADVDRQIHRLERAMEACAGLQAPLLCVDLGPLPSANVEPKQKSPVDSSLAGAIIIPGAAAQPEPVTPRAPPDPAFVSQVNAALAEVGAAADRDGCTVAFSSALASFAALQEAVTSPRCPWFGIDLDPVAILRDAWSRDEIFSTIGILIRHVRGRDAAVGPDRRTKPMPIGRGDTNWSEFLASLDGASYNGPITLDPTELPDRTAAAVAGAKYLRLLADA